MSRRVPHRWIGLPGERICGRCEADEALSTDVVSQDCIERKPHGDAKAPQRPRYSSKDGANDAARPIEEGDHA